MKCSRLSLAFFIILLLFLSLTLIKPSVAEVDSFSATLIDYQGDVSILKEETDEWLDVEINMPLQKNDNIITGEASYAEIFVDDGSTIKVEESSEINLRELTFNESSEELEIQIFLKAGILLSNIVESIQRSPSVKVYTNSAVAGVRGTEFAVEVTEEDITNIGVYSGEVEAFGLDEQGNTGDYEPVTIAEGYQTTVVKNDAPAKPFLHKQRMLLRKKKMDALRIRAVDRRKRIPQIIQKRRMIRRRIIMNRRNMNNQQSPTGTSPNKRPPIRRPIRRPPPR
jgi:hypothetical protein